MKILSKKLKLLKNQKNRIKTQNEMIYMFIIVYKNLNGI